MKFEVSAEWCNITCCADGKDITFEENKKLFMFNDRTLKSIKKVRITNKLCMFTFERDKDHKNITITTKELPHFISLLRICGLYEFLEGAPHTL